jgi:hypothetical protein
MANRQRIDLDQFPRWAAWQRSVDSPGSPIVPFSSEGYLARAEECARLANLTTDDLIQKELLLLRQTFLQTAEKLEKREKEED